MGALRKPNRCRRRRARHGLFWCGGCDGNHVGPGETCRRCGYKPEQRCDARPATVSIRTCREVPAEDLAEVSSGS